MSNAETCGRASFIRFYSPCIFNCDVMLLLSADSLCALTLLGWNESELRTPQGWEIPIFLWCISAVSHLERAISFRVPLGMRVPSNFTCLRRKRASKATTYAPNWVAPELSSKRLNCSKDCCDVSWTLLMKDASAFTSWWLWDTKLINC